MLLLVLIFSPVNGLIILGYPIVEDPLYNSTDWGPEKGKNAQYGIPIEEVIQRISNSRTASAYLQKDDEGEEQNKVILNSLVDFVLIQICVRFDVAIKLRAVLGYCS